MLASASTSGDTLQGGQGNDLLFGNGGDDTLQGGPGNDLLMGGAGDDRLTGGPNGDILSGGAGNDTFIFPALNQSLPGVTGGNNNFDVIVDFVHGQDLIDFTNLAGIDASGGVVSSFQGNITGAGNLTLNAHSVAYVETGGTTVVLVNTSVNAETVTTLDFSSANMEIALTGINLGLTNTDFLHI
jgi:Ca2+-binding RTX toxin-like protein